MERLGRSTGIDRERIARYLTELIETPTPTGREGTLADVLAEHLTGMGFDCQKHTVEPAHPLTPQAQTPYANLIAVRGGGSPIALSAHMDTVPAWGHPSAFQAVRKGDHIYGRGAVDVKGQIAALLAAVEASDAPATLLFVCDEEFGGEGSRQVPLNGVEGVVVLEPSGLQPARHFAGNVEAVAVFRGKAMHGSVPYEGAGALERLVNFSGELSRLEIIHGQKHPLFRDVPLLTLGRIEGGADPTVLSEEARVWFDVRVLPGYRASHIATALQTLAGYHGALLSIEDICEPLVTPEETPVVQIVEKAYAECGRVPCWWGYPAWTDAHNYLQRGVPAVVVGAGSLRRAHSRDEHISLTELEELARLLSTILAYASS